MADTNVVPQSDELITTKELAKLLKCSESHIAKGRMQGTADLPPFIRLGNKSIRYRAAVVHEFLDSRPQFSSTREAA